jgi:Do/DeqQ family serine protease
LLQKIKNGFFSILGLLSLNLLFLQAFDAQAVTKVVPENKTQVMFSYAPLVKKSAPAVVNIYTSKKIKVRAGGMRSPFLNDPFFSQFFGGGAFGSRLGRLQEKEVSSLGSGVLVSKGGLVITNHHVIKEGVGGNIKVVLSDKREYEAKIILGDVKTDLALIKIDVGEDLPFLELAENDDLEVGDIVLAIGNPFGVGQTVTSGIVSALARTTVGIGDYDFFIQTDAAINPGNSGGALIDMHGRLAGINTAIFSKTGTSAGIGFATPAVMAKIVLKSHERGSTRIIRPWFGAATQNVTADIAGTLDLEKPVGVLIKELFKTSAAGKAGLQLSDVVIAIDDVHVDSGEALKFRFATYDIGAKAVLTIIRDGKQLKKTIIMEPAQELPLRNTTTFGQNHLFGGATVENLSPALCDEYVIPFTKGVLIRGIPPQSYASRLFKAGDVVVKINGANIDTIAKLQKEIDASSRGWKVSVRRGNQLLTMSIGR